MTLLGPGVTVFGVPDRGLALRTAHGEFLEINTDEATMRALPDALRGTASTCATVERVVQAILTENPAGAQPQSGVTPGLGAGWRVLVLGDGALAQHMCEALAAAGAQPRIGTCAQARNGATDVAAVRDTDAVLALADGPAPPEWSELDVLPGRGIAWQRCSREGMQVLLEPVAATEGDVLHAHVRYRRRAVSIAYRELDGYWQASATGTAVHGPSPLGELEARFVAALAAADLRAWAHGSQRTGRPGWVPGTTDRRTRTLPPARRLRRIDLRDLTVTDHPVLPVPPVEPR